MTASSLRHRVVEVLCDRGPAADPRWTVGSGLFVGDGLVLTAAHAVDSGTVTIRTVDKDELPASMVVSGMAGGVDLAVVRVTTGASVVAAEFAAVSRDVPTGMLVRDCWAVGFPRFQAVAGDEDAEVRATAQVNGEIPVGDDLGSGLLNLLVNKSPRPLPPAQERLGESEWSGMSGAAVFAGERIVGVVTEHAPRRGEQSLTITPVTFIDRLADRASWWDLLGIDPDDLGRLPDVPDIARYLHAVTAELEHDAWTRFASSHGRSLSLSAIARPLAMRADGDGAAAGGHGVVDGTGLSDDWDRLVVLGGPGVGKSWLARRVGIAAAGDALRAIGDGADPSTVELPLFARIADLPAVGSVWSATVDAALARVADRLHEPRAKPLREQLIGRPGRYLVILDGLDEAGGGFTDATLDRLLAEVGERARVLVTSRPGAWRNQLQLTPNNSRHRTVRLSPLAYPADVMAVVQTWLADLPEARRRLGDALEARAELAEAARTPLLCAMFCLLAESPDGIPARRGELYRRLVTRLLRGEWRGLTQPDLDAARSALGHLALAGAVDDRRTGLADWPDAVAVRLPQPLAGEVAAAVSHVAPTQEYDADRDPQPRRFVHRSIREYLLAEHLTTLPAIEAAAAAERHLWFDVSWEPVLPAAIAAHPHRDELLRRLIAGPGEQPDELDPAGRDGFGELRQLLVRLAAETAPHDWADDTRGLIEDACHALRRTGVPGVDWLLIADAGWAAAQPGDDELEALLAADVPWSRDRIAAWLPRLDLRGARRGEVVRALIRLVSTGESTSTSFRSGQVLDAALALAALDPSPAERATAVAGLTDRLRGRLTSEWARALGVLGGTVDDAELLGLVRTQFGGDKEDYFRQYVIREVAVAVADLRAGAEVRDATAGLLLDEVSQSPEDSDASVDSWAGALRRLRPGPATLARGISLLIESTRGRDSYDRRAIAGLVQRLAYAAGDPGATVENLVSRYGPWTARDEAGVAITALARRAGEARRRAAVVAVQHRIAGSAGAAAFDWANHLMALSPTDEERRTTADALVTKLVAGPAIDTVLLAAIQTLDTANRHGRVVFDHIVTHLDASSGSGRLDLCALARPFVPDAVAAGWVTDVAIAASRDGDLPLYNYRGAIGGSPLPGERAVRAVDALVARMTKPGTRVWDAIDAIKVVKPELDAAERERITALLVSRIEREANTAGPPTLGSFLHALDDIGALADHRVRAVTLDAVLRKPTGQWEMRTLTDLLPRMALPQADRARIVDAIIEELSASPPLLHDEPVELAEALSPSPGQESRITTILVADLPTGRDVDSMVAHTIVSALVRRSLSRAQRRAVVDCCRRALAADLSNSWWVLPAAAELRVDAGERHRLVAATVKALRTADRVPSLGAPLAVLGRLSDEDIELFAKTLVDCYDRIAAQDPVVVYDPHWPRESLYDELVDLGLDALAAMDKCLPLAAGQLARRYEDPIRTLARRTRQAASYEDWTRALARWSNLDRALYTADPNDDG